MTTIGRIQLDQEPSPDKPRQLTSTLRWCTVTQSQAYESSAYFYRFIQSCKLAKMYIQQSQSTCQANYKCCVCLFVLCVCCVYMCARACVGVRVFVGLCMCVPACLCARVLVYVCGWVGVNLGVAIPRICIFWPILLSRKVTIMAKKSFY